MASYMDTVDNENDSAPTQQPRNVVTGRFGEKPNRSPEVSLITEVPFDFPDYRLTTPKLALVIGEVPLTERPAAPHPMSVPMEIPMHLRQHTNPVLSAFERNQMAHGDTSAQWAEAIEVYLDGGQGVTNREVYDQLIEIIGTPRNEADIEAWGERTSAWLTEARQSLTDTAA